MKQSIKKRKFCIVPTGSTYAWGVSDRETRVLIVYCLNREDARMFCRIKNKEQK